MAGLALPKLPTLPGGPTKGAGAKGGKQKYERGKVGHKSKTGRSECSQAMSDFKTQGSSPEVQAILGRCRSIRHTQGKAAAHAAAGNELKAAVLTKRAETGRVGAANRATLATNQQAVLNARRLARAVRERDAGKHAEIYQHLKSGGHVEFKTGSGETAHAKLHAGAQQFGLHQLDFHKPGSKRKSDSSGMVPKSTVEQWIRDANPRIVHSDYSKQMADTKAALHSIEAGRQQAAQRQRMQAAVAGATKKFTLKPKTEAHKAASEAVGSTLSAREAYNKLRQTTEHPDQLERARAIVATRNRAAQGPLKTLRAEQAHERHMKATGGGRRSSEEYTGTRVGPTRHVPAEPKPLAGAVDWKAGAAPRHTLASPSPATPAPISPLVAHQRYHALRHTEGTTPAELATARREMEASKAAAHERVSGKPMPTHEELKAQAAERLRAVQAASRAPAPAVVPPVTTHPSNTATVIATHTPGVTAPTSATTPAATPATPVGGQSHVERVKHAFEQADAENRGSNFVKIHQIREKLPDLSRAEQDAAIRQLRVSRHFAGASHEGLAATKLSEAEKASAIHEGTSKLVYLEHGEHYAGPPKGAASGATASKPTVAPASTMTEAQKGNITAAGRKHLAARTGAAVAKMKAEQLKAAAPPASSAPAASSHAVDLPTFASRVKAAAATVGKEGRFGDNKVFIHAAHEAYQKAHGPIPLETFKAKLLEANTGRHLNLSRADMVSAMHPEHVRKSSTKIYLGPGPHTDYSHAAEFHFLRI